MSTAERPIPKELELIRDFVNTRDLEPEHDEISEPRALAAWLSERGLLPKGARATRTHVERAVEFREALRTLLLAHNEEGIDTTEAAQAIDRAARQAALEVRFNPDCTTELVPAATGAAAAIGQLVAIVADVAGTEEWSRLKACRRESCLFAFYDQARNRSRAWCSMEVCGNREKAQKFRARHAH
jgi:predicted RNA-binding Zn ribbon-like protein